MQIFAKNVQYIIRQTRVVTSNQAHEPLDNRLKLLSTESISNCIQTHGSKNVKRIKVFV